MRDIVLLQLGYIWMTVCFYGYVVRVSMSQSRYRNVTSRF